GPAGGLAILKSDLGAGLRTAAPLALLNALALCAHAGILIKRGRALELMNEVDTIVFDKTAIVSQGRPEVVQIRTGEGFAPEELLQLAAAAEQPFHHPIARAILDKACELDLDLPEIDDVQYRVGHGVITQVSGQTVCVGNRRLMEKGEIPLPSEWDDV